MPHSCRQQGSRRRQSSPCRRATSVAEANFHSAHGWSEQMDHADTRQCACRAQALQNSGPGRVRLHVAARMEAEQSAGRSAHCMRSSMVQVKHEQLIDHRGGKQLLSQVCAKMGSCRHRVHSAYHHQNHHCETQPRLPAHAQGLRHGCGARYQEGREAGQRAQCCMDDVQDCQKIIKVQAHHRRAQLRCVEGAHPPVRLTPQTLRCSAIAVLLGCAGPRWQHI